MKSLSPKPSLVKKSRFCQPFDWSNGSLNDSTYQAFCKFARFVLDQHGPQASDVLREVARLIQKAGGAANKEKLIQQFRDAFAFVAEEIAAESLGAQQFHAAKPKWPEPEPS